jgi:hypothetical protein
MPWPVYRTITIRYSNIWRFIGYREYLSVLHRIKASLDKYRIGTSAGMGTDCDTLNAHISSNGVIVPHKSRTRNPTAMGGRPACGEVFCSTNPKIFPLE